MQSGVLKRFICVFLIIACVASGAFYWGRTVGYGEGLSAEKSVEDELIREEQAEETGNQAQIEIEDRITVYITVTGEKYHRQNCQHVRKSCVSVSLFEAKKRGYSPCSRCHPPK